MFKSLEWLVHVVESRSRTTKKEESDSEVFGIDSIVLVLTHTLAIAPLWSFTLAKSLGEPLGMLSFPRAVANVEVWKKAGLEYELEEWYP